MPSCQAVNFNGKICGRDAKDSSYFWFKDQHQRINREFSLCHDHSNSIINSLMTSEKAYQVILDRLYKIKDNLTAKKNKGSNLEEEQVKYREAKEQGLPRPKFKSHVDIEKELSETWNKIKKFKELKNKIRNHTCRYCDHALKEPDDLQNQIGAKFSHADFHAGSGYRREVFLFHTECAITWILHCVKLTEKEVKYVRPQLEGQGLLFH